LKQTNKKSTNKNMVYGEEPTKGAGIYQRYLAEELHCKYYIGCTRKGEKKKGLEMRLNICLHKDLSMV